MFSFYRCPPSFANKVCRQMLSIVGFYTAGHIKPIHPIKVFSAAAIHKAFQYMQQGVHLGKIVISMRDASTGTIQLQEGTEVAKREIAVALDGTAYYLLVGGLGGLGRDLLVGGLGGLGRAIASWMAEQGARNLIFLSRSATGRQCRAAGLPWRAGQHGLRSAPRAGQCPVVG